MRMIFGLVLTVGLALAGAAVWMVQGYVGTAQTELQRERAARAKLGNLVKAYIVTKPLNYGDPIRKEDVRLVTFPENALPQGTFAKEEELFPGDALKLRHVIRQLDAAELVLASKITAPGEEAGLTARLAKGMRAFTIKVDRTSGISGHVYPGDFVDLYWTGNTPGSKGEITQLIESAVKIIAVDQEANVDRSETKLARNMTVEVTPQQVARLAQAQATGRIALSLVGQGDTTQLAGIEVDSRELLGITKAAPQRIERERVCTVRTRRGGDVMEIPIPCTN
ncbi:MAG: Flp pilus assembly protein CpaB [Pseudorhodobacter sp.]